MRIYIYICIHDMCIYIYIYAYIRIIVIITNEHHSEPGVMLISDAHSNEHRQ